MNSYSTFRLLVSSEGSLVIFPFVDAGKHEFGLFSSLFDLHLPLLSLSDGRRVEFIFTTLVRFNGELSKVGVDGFDIGLKLEKS